MGQALGWRDAAVNEIYLPAFSDHDGDDIGDFRIGDPSPATRPGSALTRYG